MHKIAAILLRTDWVISSWLSHFVIASGSLVGASVGAAVAIVAGGSGLVQSAESYIYTLCWIPTSVTVRGGARGVDLNLPPTAGPIKEAASVLAQRPPRLERKAGRSTCADGQSREFYTATDCDVTTTDPQPPLPLAPLRSSGMAQQERWRDHRRDVVHCTRSAITPQRLRASYHPLTPNLDRSTPTAT